MPKIKRAKDFFRDLEWMSALLLTVVLLITTVIGLIQKIPFFYIWVGFIFVLGVSSLLWVGWRTRNRKRVDFLSSFGDRFVEVLFDSIDHLQEARKLLDQTVKETHEVTDSRNWIRLEGDALRLANMIVVWRKAGIKHDLSSADFTIEYVIVAVQGMRGIERNILSETHDLRHEITETKDKAIKAKSVDGVVTSNLLKSWHDVLEKLEKNYEYKHKE